MLLKKQNILTAEAKKPICYDVCYREDETPKPIVLFCHGYKGFKDWGTWDLVAEAFAEAGFFFLKFNFSHNGGTVEDPIDFPDLEAFANNNFSKELDDLDRILHFISSENEFSPQLNSEKISLIGHSRGGGIVLIKAEEDERVQKVVTWAGVCDFKLRFQEGTDSFKEWQKKGITYIENTRTKQQLPHYIQFYEDFIANEERFTIKRAVQNLSKPQLIIQGDDDPTVTIKEAEALHFWNPKSTLKIIENGDHVFGGTHPWTEEELPTALKKVVAESSTFIK
ncbi:alpha/beta hydrolase family protein [Ulvibacter litoralis]|uniref:Serine aminopeptidase, S33 n=1 Tax=Ulvibacter litoralis TaxID=227084 RepID=A0A1G7DFD1_9FLAO|nr:alpha/beta fold hydrolase [Ulvibacter litoralis]GHC43838.1 alpha/beta hydrolase [Ulvibacter litoralis]SDE49730.1 Serine aminopeptidase, S33 [Ulvibacter litoralis]